MLSDIAEKEREREREREEGSGGIEYLGEGWKTVCDETVGGVSLYEDQFVFHNSRCGDVAKSIPTIQQSNLILCRLHLDLSMNPSGFAFLITV